LGRSFNNILGYEFHYAYDISPSFQFRPEPPAFRGAMSILHQVLTVAVVVVLVAAAILAARRIWKTLRTGRGGLAWIDLFFLLLGVSFLARVLLLLPKPFLEARHNMDLALLVVLASFFVLDALVRIRPPSILGSAAAVLALLLLAAPHTFYYLKATRFKALSYDRIFSVLKARGVRAVATDFTLAHCLYFLSGRTITASDSIGPVTVRHFLPEITKSVDALPPDQKAYILYTPSYPYTPIMRISAPLIRQRILDDLRSRGIPFRIFDLKYYEIIIPRSIPKTDES
jgi:hypothetical protein